jgi:HlyD family secretion protein
MWRIKLTGLLLSLVAGVAQAAPAPMLLTGEVYSREAQEIIVPLTNNWQARISRMVPEGSYVEAGDVVVEFDGTEAALAMEQQRETTRTELARTERDLAQLEKALAQAQQQQRQAAVMLELSSMKAEIPETLIGAIEHAENQLAKEEAIKAVEDAHKQVADQRQSLADRIRQAELDAKKNELQAQWWSEMLESFMVTARQAGYVIYGNHPWTRAKYQEGDNVRTSFKIAQVANTRNLAIKVWINSVDRPRIQAGETVRIVLDALPDMEVSGVIETVLDSGSKRQEWGEGVYFEGIVTFSGAQPRGLLPGMSVLVEVES